MDVVINDSRNSKNFTKITFSGFKKTDVFNTLMKSIINNNIETSCYWSCDCICSGYFIELWELIILFISKYIHIGNPKLCVYIENCINKFKNIVNECNDELELRNNSDIRKLFSEIICVLCKSNRKHPFVENKINSTHYDLTNLGNKLKSNNMQYIDDIFKPEDVKELYVGLNELYYNICESKDTTMACYWIDWIIEFDNMIRKSKQYSPYCKERNYISCDKEKKNIIWIVWDIILKISETKKIVNTLIKSLLSIFTLKFNKNTPKKRKYILYNCVSLLTENVNFSTPIIDDLNIINSVHENIFKIYKQIKTNEKNDIDIAMFNQKSKPKSKKEANLEKSMNKLDIINNLLK